MEKVQQPGSASRGPIELTCEQCAGVFRRFPSTAAGARYCSDKCKRSSNYLGRNSVPCVVCQVVVQRRKYKPAINVICSKACSRVLRSTTLTRISQAQVEQSCRVCERIYYRDPSRPNKGVCSKACVAMAQRNVERVPRTDPQQCIGCLEFKPLTTAFAVSRGTLRSRRCNACRTLSGTSPEAKRRSHLRVKFGLSLEDWITMYQRQNGGCAICTIALPSLDAVTNTAIRRRGDAWKRNDWNTDHCHKTGKVRGILCRGCNQALGSLRDDPVRARRAAEYLEMHQST